MSKRQQATRPRAVARDHIIRTGQTEAGRFTAASTVSPYFYFECDTQEEALDLARKAFNYYYGDEGTVQPLKPRSEPKISRVTKTKKITLDIGSFGGGGMAPAAA